MQAIEGSRRGNTQTAHIENTWPLLVSWPLRWQHTQLAAPDPSEFTGLWGDGSHSVGARMKVTLTTVLPTFLLPTWVGAI